MNMKWTMIAAAMTLGFGLAAPVTASAGGIVNLGCNVPEGLLKQIAKGGDSRDRAYRTLASINTDAGGGNGSETFIAGSLFFVQGVACLSGLPVDDMDFNINASDLDAPSGFISADIATDPGNSLPNDQD